jgi:hypothetical protein
LTNVFQNSDDVPDTKAVGIRLVFIQKDSGVEEEVPIKAKPTVQKQQDALPNMAQPSPERASSSSFPSPERVSSSSFPSENTGIGAAKQWMHSIVHDKAFREGISFILIVCISCEWLPCFCFFFVILFHISHIRNPGTSEGEHSQATRVHRWHVQASDCP